MKQKVQPFTQNLTFMKHKTQKMT